MSVNAMKKLTVLGPLTLALVLFGLVGDAQWAIVTSGTQRGGGCELCTDLVAYWPLDELSGQRNDIVGTNHLTDNNTVGYQLQGPVGTVASFAGGASGEFLGADPGVPLLTGDFTISAWAYVENTGTYALEGAGIFTKIETGDAAGSVMLNMTSALKPRFVYFTGAGLSGLLADDAVSIGWHHIVARSLSGTRTLWIDGIQVAATAAAVGGGWGTQHTRIGDAYPSGGYFYADPIGPVGVWTVALDAPKITSLYNSGVAKKYAELTAGEKVGLVSYWNLDEAGGNRADSFGANTLTDNNTVGSVVNAGGAMHNAAARFSFAANEFLSNTTLTVGTGPWTVAMWAKLPTAQPTNNMWLWQQIGAAPSFLEHSISRPGFSTSIYVRSGDVVAAVAGLPTDQWVLVVGWFDGSLTHVSINDGAVQDSTPRTTTPIEPPVITYFGSRDGYGTQDDSLDEVALWSAVKAAPDRSALYAAGAGIFYNGSVFADLWLVRPWRNARNDWLFYRGPRRVLPLRRAS